MLQVNPYVDALIVGPSLRRIFRSYPILALAAEPTLMRDHLVRHSEVTRASPPIRRHQHVDVAVSVVNLLRRMFRPPPRPVCKMEAMPMSQAHLVYYAPGRKMTGKVSLM